MNGVNPKTIIIIIIIIIIINIFIIINIIINIIIIITWREIIFWMGSIWSKQSNRVFFWGIAVKIQSQKTHSGKSNMRFPGKILYLH